MNVAIRSSLIVRFIIPLSLISTQIQSAEQRWLFHDSCIFFGGVLVAGASLLGRYFLKHFEQPNRGAKQTSASQPSLTDTRTFLWNKQNSLRCLTVRGNCDLSIQKERDEVPVGLVIERLSQCKQDGLVIPIENGFAIQNDSNSEKIEAALTVARNEITNFQPFQLDLNEGSGNIRNLDNIAICIKCNSFRSTIIKQDSTDCTTKGLKVLTNGTIVPFVEL